MGAATGIDSTDNHAGIARNRDVANGRTARGGADIANLHRTAAGIDQHTTGTAATINGANGDTTAGARHTQTVATAKLHIGQRCGAITRIHRQVVAGADGNVATGELH